MGEKSQMSDESRRTVGQFMVLISGMVLVGFVYLQTVDGWALIGGMVMVFILLGMQSVKPNLAVKQGFAALVCNFIITFLVVVGKEQDPAILLVLFAVLFVMFVME